MSVTVTRFFTVQTDNYPALLEHLKIGRSRAEQRGVSQRFAWRRFIIGGPGANVHYVNSEYPSMSAWAERQEELNADPAFQAYVQQGAALGLTLTGAGIRRSLAHFGPPLPAPGSLVSLVRTWRVEPGRTDEFLGRVEQVVALSGDSEMSVGVSQVIVGGENTGRVITVGTFSSMAALGGFVDRLNSDAELTRLRAQATGPDAPAEMLTTAISADLPV